MTKEKITIEFEVEAAQEIHASLETLSNKLAWVLENQMPRNPASLRIRQKLISAVAKRFKDALNERARNNGSIKTAK